MTGPQHRALRLIEKMGGEISDRAIDGRVLAGLCRNRLVTWSATRNNTLVMTPEARAELASLSAEPIVRPRDPSSRELVERVEREVAPRIPDFADVEPEPDGMTEICCRAMEDAIAAKVVRVESRAGRAYVSGGAKHWLIHFCPFCGESRATDGGRLDVDE